jgi:hypothetical protein
VVSSILHASRTNRVNNSSISIWKDKVKEWNFWKYLPRDTMHAIVAVQSQRAILKRKKTSFFCGEVPITEEKIENFKKKHRQDLVSPMSFSE